MAPSPSSGQWRRLLPPYPKNSSRERGSLQTRLCQSDHPCRSVEQQGWLVSGNPLDVIGAKGAGLKAAWVRRGSAEAFDPWEYVPDITVGDLVELCATLPRH